MAIFFIQRFYSGMLNINQLKLNKNYSKNQVGFTCNQSDVKVDSQPQIQQQAASKTSSDSPFKDFCPSLDGFKSNMLNINPQNKLKIYYYNDVHGHTDQIMGIAKAAKEFKRENSDVANFVFSAGDNVSGGDGKKNEFVFDLMQNEMQTDASAVGNHETDGGNGECFEETVEDIRIPFIATNATFEKDSPMDEFVQKSKIIEKNGVKYGILGTMPMDIKTCTKADSQKGIEVMDFDNTVKALQEQINEFKKQGINRIILLSHAGYDQDKNLAKNLDGIDIIVGGHTHSVVNGATEGENVVQSKSNEPVVIVQAGENAKYYGTLDVDFDNDGKLVQINNKLHQSVSLTKSPVVEYLKKLKLGESPKVGVLEEVDPMPENRRIEPHGWIEVMADSMKNELGTDIAIINSANIRKVPQIGTITENDITESAPMKNKLIKTKLTQKQLVEAVKNAAKKTMTDPDGVPGLLIGSGFTYTITDKGDLVDFNIIDKNNNKTPVDINNPSQDITYSAAYDEFTAKKEGGETPELAPEFPVEIFDYDKDKTMMSYLSKMPNKEKLSIKHDGRVEIQKT